MSVIWSGVTEEGAVVPVQVTAEGKVVAVGDGPVGDYLPITGGELTGDLEVDGSLTVEGSGVFAGELRANDNQFISASNGAFAFSRNNENFQVSMNSGPVSVTGATSAAIQGFYKDTNTNTFAIFYDGSAQFASSISTTGFTLQNDNFGCYRLLKTSTQAVLELKHGNGATDGSDVISCYSGDEKVARVGNDGSADFAGGKCGFTTEGDLIFTSRGTRYKLFVSQGVCQAEPYTREMELKEKAEQFIADKRETKPSNPSTQSQPEVTSDNDNA